MSGEKRWARKKQALRKMPAAFPEKAGFLQLGRGLPFFPSGSFHGCKATPSVRICRKF